MREASTALNVALEQLRMVAEKLELDSGIHEMLKSQAITSRLSYNKNG